MKFIRQSLAHKTGFLIALPIFLLASFFYYARLHGYAITSFQIGFGAFVTILLLLIGVILVFLIWHVIWPLRQVTREMRALLAGQSYRKIELENKIDEIGLLAQFFNAVVTSLEKLSEDIRQHQRLSAEADFASEVQKKLLPKKSPYVPGLDVVVKTRSASEVGGDNFDIIARDKSALLYIGDATGHGFPAGLIMTMVNVLVHSFSSIFESSQEVLVNVNRVLTPKIKATMFMTLAMLRWEYATQKLFYTGCGHEHLLIYHSADQQCEALPTGGIALGMVKDSSKIVKEKTLELNAGDIVVLFTDGITEAKNQSGEMFGVERLRQYVEHHAKIGGTAQGIFSGISKEFATFVGANHKQADDITMLVVKIDPSKIEAKKKIALEINTADLSRPADWSW